MAAATLAEDHRRMDALALFARRTAHDLSNFLTVIRTYSELLQADLPPDHPGRPDLDEIAQAADTTVEYMQRTSAFGRAAGSKPSTFALDACVTASVNTAATADGHRLDLSVESAASVTGSAAALTDAVQELVSNAREASPPDAVITVRTLLELVPEDVVRDGVPLAAATWAVVEISDGGAGVPAHIARSACDPFVTTKSGVRGAGFGLTMARATAWAFGGELTLGRAADRTVARLYLPVAREA